jgi:protein-tyrosine phosphatase
VIRILFVCLGNICRSPAAEGAFRHIVEQKELSDLFFIDSAGTGDWHVGELPHFTTRQVAKERGISLTHRARQFTPEDLDKFDFILTMDASNFKNVYRHAKTEEHKAKIIKFRKFDPSAKNEPDVPDPYYGELSGFEHVQDIVERTSLGFLNWILAQKSNEDQTQVLQ